MACAVVLDKVMEFDVWESSVLVHKFYIPSMVLLDINRELNCTMKVKIGLNDKVSGWRFRISNL